jgi:hypothetical protein
MKVYLLVRANHSNVLCTDIQWKLYILNVTYVSIATCLCTARLG